MTEVDDECIHGLDPATCSICKAPKGRPGTSGGTSNSSDGRKTPDNSSHYFGHTWDEWFAMCDAGASYILERAEQGHLVTYGELWDAVELRIGRPLGNHWRQLPMLLGYISEQTFAEKHALITALVVDEVNPRPNEGFFRLATAHGLIHPEDAPPVGVPWSGELTKRQREFWLSQLAALGFRVRS